MTSRLGLLCASAILDQFYRTIICSLRASARQNPERPRRRDVNIVISMLLKNLREDLLFGFSDYKKSQPDAPVVATRHDGAK